MKNPFLKNVKEINVLTKEQLRYIVSGIELDCEDPNLIIIDNKLLCYDLNAECISGLG